MNKTKSIVAIIMVMIVTLIGFTACKNNCKKDGEKCEKASCCKDTPCCDKCNKDCTSENKCCDKCKVGEEKSCCKKDSTACTKDSSACTKEEKKECCKKDSTKH